MNCSCDCRADGSGYDSEFETSGVSYGVFSVRVTRKVSTYLQIRR